MKEQTHHTKKLVSSLAPATSHISQTGDYINWYKANRYVKGMQVRIAKATQESNWRLKLTTNAYPLVLCKSISSTTGDGKYRQTKSAGIDKRIWIHLNPNGLLYKIHQVKGINLNH